MTDGVKLVGPGKRYEILFPDFCVVEKQHLFCPLWRTASLTAASEASGTVAPAEGEKPWALINTRSAWIRQ